MNPVKEPKNCWEFWGCQPESRDDCPVYQTNSGRICWQVPHHGDGLFRKRIEQCALCDWYKKMNGLM
ncbi:MAG: hypothetical protein JXD21_03985 [Candidatus Omnitrophica bacterium]|nr:hypothetical protein [Candidatus Omnitrophota bacterium]